MQTTQGRDAGRGFNPLSLDAVNFLLADVRGAVGPYLNVFLVTQQRWSQSEVGFVTMIGGLQKLAAAHPKEATAMMSACIIAAQLVMLPFALLVGRTADSWGRKPLFLLGFAILPIRAASTPSPTTAPG
ncbi:MAG TPA: hypothetical protein VJO12_03520 [Stellaceae bacterium]|nr:hypothetical protein [Stellaceae bacterium]